MITRTAPVIKKMINSPPRSLSIEPRAELPTDMKENYHFGEM